MKRWPRHAADAISRESLLKSARSLERIKQNTRAESVGRGEKAKFGGWYGDGEGVGRGVGSGGAEKRGNEGVELAGVSIWWDLYPDGYGRNGREGVEVRSQRRRRICWWGQVRDVWTREVDFHG